MGPAASKAAVDAISAQVDVLRDIYDAVADLAATSVSTLAAGLGPYPWDELDVVIVSGDAYVDHPAFGPPLIGRTVVAALVRASPHCQHDRPCTRPSSWDRPTAASAVGGPAGANAPLAPARAGASSANHDSITTPG